MNEQTNQEEIPVDEKPAIKKEMSRRQFLSYTLGGTGAFLMTLPLVVNLRFAIDPLLQAEGSWILSGWQKRVRLQRHRNHSASASTSSTDGMKTNREMQAWISRDANGNIFALSPICKHLGCTVTGIPMRIFRMSIFVLAMAPTIRKTAKAWLSPNEPLDEYEVLDSRRLCVFRQYQAEREGIVGGVQTDVEEDLQLD